MNAPPTPAGSAPRSPTGADRGDAQSIDAGDQREVLAFLADPQSWHPVPPRVEHVETHGAHVFLAGDRAIKIKRAVHYDYMDFSTLEQRRTVIESEIVLNRRFAPGLYLGVVAITRGPDGRLAIGGGGVPVEWAVVMRRFDDNALLSAIVRRGPLGRDVVKALAATVLASHHAAPPHDECDVIAQSRALIRDVSAQIRASGGASIEADARRFEALATHALDRIGPLLQQRCRSGFVRRCHGDLHLANIVLLDGRPTLYDALEFNEALATVDTFHDLAFLLMDLDARRQRPAANLLLAHYLWLSNDDRDVSGLAALPLFLALRAAVRAMVGLQRRTQVEASAAARGDPAPSSYLGLSLAYLLPSPPRLVAVGGLSGTGKSTLAAALAPRFGAAPGALHLRSDLERKRLAGVGELDRLPPLAYGPGTSDAVYRLLLGRAHTALAAGHAVIVDAVFQREEERQAAEAVARYLGVAFTGLWLEADQSVMLARIRERRHDASDATPDVALAQLARDCGTIAWHRIDAGHDPGRTIAAAASAIGLDTAQSLSST